MQSVTASQVFISRAQARAYGGNSSDILDFLEHESTRRTLDSIVTPTEARMIDKVKPAFRLVQAADFITTQIVSGHETTGKVKRNYNEVTAIISAIVARIPDNIVVAFGDVHRVIGVTRENTSPVPGADKPALNRLLGIVVNPGTVGSMTSRTVGTGGFFNVLKITEKVSNGSFRVVNRNHPVLLAYIAALGKLTDGQLDFIENEKNRKASK